MKSKLIIITAAVIFIITVILLFYLNSTSEKGVVQRFQAEQLVAARTLAREIESYLRNRSRGVELLSTFTSFQKRDMNAIATTIKEYFEYLKKDHVKAITVYDEKGTIICSTAEGVLGSNYAKSDFFQWATKKENKDKQFISSLVGVTDQQIEHIPNFRFLIAAPIYYEGIPTGQAVENPQHPKPLHNFIGVVTATVDLEEVIAAFLPIASSYAAKEKVWIVDKDGTLLFQSGHPEMVLRNIRSQDKTCLKCHVTFEHVETILNKRQGTTEYQLKDKTKILTSYSSIEFKNISWTIVINIPFEEISGFINTNLILTFILIGIITLSLIGGSLLFYRSSRLKIRAQEEAKQWMEKHELEDKIRESEERYRTVVDISPDAVIIHCEGKIVFVNPAAVEMVGASSPNDLLGKPAIEFVHPDERESTSKRILEILKSGKTSQWLEERFIRMDGSIIYVETVGIPTTYNGKLAVQVIAHDMTERKQAEEQIRRLNRIYSVLSNINQAIVRIHDINQLFNDICRIAIEDGKFRMAWIGTVNTDSRKVEVVASAGFTSDYLTKINIDLNDEKRSQGPTGRTIISGTHSISNDIEHDESMVPWRDGAKKHGYKSAASFPIKVFGMVRGVFNMYSSQVGFFDEDEIKLLDELAMDISFALEFIERDAQRKQVEEALQESEEGFRRLFEEPTDPILLLNQKCFFNCNSAALSILLFNSKDEIENKTPWDLSPEFQPDGKLSSEKAVEMISTAKQNGFHRFEWVHTKKDGTNFFVEVMLTPIELHGEEIFHVIWRDITERKLAEEALRENEERLRTIIETEPECVKVVDRGGQLLEMNAAGLAMLEAESISQVQQHTLYNFILPEYRASFGALHKRVMNGENGILEFEIMGLRGTRRWLETHAAPMRDATGEVTKLLGVTRNITERKRAEEEIIFQKNRFAQLFENSPIAIALLDDKDKIVHINESFSGLFGYFLEEIKGQPLNDIIVPTELKEEAESYSDQTRAGNQINKESYRRRKDGTLVYVQIIGVPVNIIDKTVGIYGMYMDLTPRKEVEDKMKMAKELAEQSDKMKTEFLAQMSHEIRTPINIMVGNVGYLSELFGEKMDTEARGCFDGIDLASKRIIRTVELILNMSELQTGIYKPSFEIVDIDSQVLKNLYNEYQLVAKQKGIDFIYKCKVKESEIICDEYCVTQIFANLIDNAIKYTKKGKVEILLDKNSSGNILVEIKDTGIGISKEFLARMFDPFVQEEQGYTRAYEGNGLGLALVKNYCNLNNAIIEVESEKNFGSTFRVIFNRK